MGHGQVQGQGGCGRSRLGCWGITVKAGEAVGFGLFIVHSSVWPHGPISGAVVGITQDY